MELWLFFTIFGLVLFVPSTLAIIFYNRFKNTIILLVKVNGALKKIIITDKELEKGVVSFDGKKKIKPIKIQKDEVYFGKWRRWIIKGELETRNQEVTDKEVEEYLNNEDLIKLYLAGKFKDTLMILLGIIIVCIIVSGGINIYLTTSQVNVLTPTNETTAYIRSIVIDALRNYTTG
jgi:hypothetical protein